MTGGGAECLHHNAAMPDSINGNVAEFAVGEFLQLCLRFVCGAADGVFNAAPLRERAPFRDRIYTDNAASVYLEHLRGEVTDKPHSKHNDGGVCRDFGDDDGSHRNAGHARCGDNVRFYRLRDGCDEPVLRVTDSRCVSSVCEDARAGLGSRYVRADFAHDADVGVAGTPRIGAPRTFLENFRLSPGVVGEFGAAADEGVFSVNEHFVGRQCGGIKFGGLEFHLILPSDDDFSDCHEAFPSPSSFFLISRMSACIRLYLTRPTKKVAMPSKMKITPIVSTTGELKILRCTKDNPATNSVSAVRMYAKNVRSFARIVRSAAR